MNSSRHPLRRAFAALLLTAGLIAQAAAQPSPTDRLETAVDEVTGVLQDESISRLERRERVRELVYEFFDFRAISQSVLSTNWRNASPEQQERFQELFSKLLENTYVDRLDAYDYNNEEVSFRGEQVNGNRAEVRSVIVTRDTNIPVDYRLRLKDGQWYVYDVIVENVSLVSNYREEFRGVVSNRGIDGLLEQMEQKITQLQQRQSATAGAAAG